MLRQVGLQGPELELRRAIGFRADHIGWFSKGEGHPAAELMHCAPVPLARNTQGPLAVIRASSTLCSTDPEFACRSAPAVPGHGPLFAHAGAEMAMGFSADRFRGRIEALHQTTPKAEDLASCGTCGSQCARRRAGFTPIHLPARRIAEVIVAGGGSRQMDERVRTGSDRLRFQSFRLQWLGISAPTTDATNVSKSS